MSLNQKTGWALHSGICPVFFSLLVCFFFTGSLPSFSEETQTIEDIRRKLNLSSSASSSQKKEKKKFEIKSIRTVVPGWQRHDEKRGSVAVQGLEVTFRINEKGDTLAVPCCVCYFYDKEKNLLERKKPDFWYPEGSSECKELEGDLFIKGKKDERIIFVYPSNSRFKYALCVIGNDQTVSVATFPKSLSPDDFEFDEKELSHAG